MSTQRKEVCNSEKNCDTCMASNANYMCHGKDSHYKRDRKNTEEFFDAQDSNETLEKSDPKILAKTNSRLASELSLKQESCSSYLSQFSVWAGSTYKVDYTLKFAQYLLWVLSKLYSSEGLRNFYSQISKSRYVMRFFGTPLALNAIKTRCWSAGWTDKRIHQLTDIMAWSMLFYYPLEHIAFTKWVSPKMIKANAEFHSAVSCQFWSIYVAADMGALTVKIRELKNRRKQVLLMKKENSISKKSADHELNSLQKKIKYNRLHAIRCLLLVLPCINWSLPKWERDPWLKEEIINSLMFTESVVCLYQQIFAV